VLLHSQLQYTSGVEIKNRGVEERWNEGSDQGGSRKRVKKVCSSQSGRGGGGVEAYGRSGLSPLSWLEWGPLNAKIPCLVT